MIDNEVDILNESAACENFDDFIDYLEGEATDKNSGGLPGFYSSWFF